MRRLTIAAILAAALQAQTPSFRPLHVSPVGIIVNDSSNPVLLRGLNRSGTGSGNADGNSADQDYAAQNQLLSMNLVRIFVNATWWTNNVTVPIAGQPYQTYIDGLIQRAKKYGNYVVILKAGQFPEAPCGSSGANCPAANQGELDCQANSSLCPAEDTTGNYIDGAISFWAAVAQKYAADPAVLYDTWEDMHSIDMGTWSDGQNQLIATIRTYNPQALIFVEDTAAAFEAIVSGALPDLAWPNIVWSFHLYAGPSGTCTETASPRYANWPHNFDPLVGYAQQYGHAAAIMEWGGCNDSDPYHANITSYAQTHDMALAYFDSSNLIMQSGGAYQLTATGTKVAAAYTAIVAAGPPPNSGVPVVQGVQDAINNRVQIVPGSWVSVYGASFSAITKDWSDQSFANGLPTSVADVQVLVDGSPAPVWYVSAGQINFQAPTTMGATASVAVARNGVASNPATVAVVSSSPGVIAYSADYVTFYPSAQFAGTTNIVGDPAVFGFAKKAKPGDQIQIYVTGLAITQSGVLINAPITFTAPVKVNLGSVSVTPSFTGQIGAGYYQINFAVPTLAAGNYPFTITVNGLTSQNNVVFVVGP
jgi:uncharacterized protein (TIGR03437 family)